ncbi:DUF4862 family protein [Arthrobacter sp. NPDC058130]|uniref:DUF4862 family protein n=1 Tax=Arthrobacter sp. NPDC058130 TaxID=3346353 RepID=UPI0036EC23C3
MARLQDDATFGLASTSEAGRRAAVEFVGEALEAVRRLGTHTSPSAVTALELHAAPVAEGNRASAAALAESLMEISDVHVPPAPHGIQDEAGQGAASGVLEPASLLTAARIRECLDAAGTGTGTGFRGIKVAADPRASVEERVATIAQTIALIRQAGAS